MADDKFKLPRSSYEEICKIIKAYGRVTQPASLDDVAKFCAMGKTVISANIAFLVNIGLIEGGQKKIATLKGSGLAKALEHELPDQIQESWAGVVRGNEFLGKMAAAVKIRGKMDMSTLESHIAYSAGEAKSGPVMTGARAVIDMLRAGGVVREYEGQLISTEAKIDVCEATHQSASEALQTLPARNSLTQTILSQPLAPTAGASLHIELRIDAKPSELNGLGEKIQQLLQALNRPYKVGENDSADNS